MSKAEKGLAMKYFVLKPRGSDPYAEASRAAMLSYSGSIRGFDPELAGDLYSWADAEERRDADERVEEARKIDWSDPNDGGR
jgi:hypothetical protein